MTRQLDPTSPETEPDRDDLRRLARIPDEEQRGLAYRDLLRRSGRSEEITDLSIAENALLYPLLTERIFQKLPHPLPEKSTRYVSPQATGQIITAMAGHFQHSFGVRHVDPKTVYATAGVSSALEIIALALQNPTVDGAVPVPRGDTGPVPRGSNVLIPAPYWQGFNWSFEEVPGLKCVPVRTYKEGNASRQDTFELTVDDLEGAYAACAQPPRLLVLTNPHNPLGVNYPRDLLNAIYDWALAKSPQMHIISDEIYRHSQLAHTTDPFVSALELAEQHQAVDRVHVVWGFAKDFGLSGFRSGFIVSQSDAVQRAMTEDTSDPWERRRPLSWFSQFDSLKQFYLDPVTALDPQAWSELMAEYSSRLQESFDAVSATLDRYGIKYFRPQGTNSTQFFWLDLREFLLGAPPAEGPETVLFGDDPDDAEQRLATYILKEAKVKLLTGATMYQMQPQGFYRLCFTAERLDALRPAVERLCLALRKLDS